MKTKVNIPAKWALLIATIAFGFQAGLIQARTPDKDTPLKGSSVVSIAPVTPKTAHFDALILINRISVINLAPETPEEATFTDEYEALPISCMAPVTPDSADFSDSDPIHETASVFLLTRPVPPPDATFDE